MEPRKKVGFLTHYDALTKLPESFDYLTDCILKQVSHKSSEFDVRLIGGWDESDPIIEFLKSNLDQNRKIKMNLVEEDIGRGGLIKNVALDRYKDWKDLFLFSKVKSFPYQN